jgi:hypothetical protein
MKRREQERNLLDLRPVRLMQHRLEGERVVVLIPRFRSRWMGWYQRLLKNPHLKLQLDDLGTAVWLSCDGEHTVSSIGRLLQDRFGDSVEPVWDRLALFLRQMRAGRLIDLKD